MKFSHKNALQNIVIILVLTFIIGCGASGYNPSAEINVNEALKPMPIEVLRLQASNINHPLLKPLELDLRDGLSSDEAAIIAVLENPSLRVVRSQRGIAQAQLLAAGILPNPQLSFGLDWPVDVKAGEKNVLGYGLGVNWDISALISRQAKIDAAKTKAASVDLDIAWQEWQIAQAARIAVFRQIALENELELARQINTQFEKSLEVIKKAVELQQKTSVDLAAAQTESEDSRTTVLEINRDLQKQKLGLLKLLGLPADANIVLESKTTLPSRPSFPSESELIDNLEKRRLDLLALKLGCESQDSAVRTAILSGFPKIDLGVNFSRDTTDEKAIGPSIAIDLPIFDRNQGGIAIEKATGQMLINEYINRVFEARSDVSMLLVDINSLSNQIDAAEKALSASEQLVVALKTEYENGNADIMNYYLAQKDLNKKRIEILKLKQGLSEMYIGLEIASGRYFPPETMSKL